MRRPTFLLAATTALILLSSPARAEDLAAARALFEQGRQLMKGGKVAEACPKFEAAAQLSPTAGVRLNLAVCWAKLGRTASAWAMFEQARAIAERNGESGQVELATKGRTDLESKLSHLLVTVPPASNGAVDVQVMRDGEPLLPGAWGVPVPVDPGSHEVSARSSGRSFWSTKVAVPADGSTITVVVPAPEATKSEVATVPMVPPPAVGTATAPPRQAETDKPTPAPPGATQRVIGAVVGGVGVVGLGVASYFGLHASSEKSTYQAHEAAGHCIDLTCQTESHSAASAADTSTAFFIAGGALVATGVVVWLTAPRSHETGVTARIVPATGVRTAGLSLEGSW